MTNDYLDRELAAVDFSKFSKVRESLLQTLLQKHRQNNFKGFKGLSQEIFAERMTDEELDYAVAAGNPNAMNNPEKNNYPPKKFLS